MRLCHLFSRSVLGLHYLSRMFASLTSSQDISSTNEFSIFLGCSLLSHPRKFSIFLGCSEIASNFFTSSQDISSHCIFYLSRMFASLTSSQVFYLSRMFASLTSSQDRLHLGKTNQQVDLFFFMLSLIESFQQAETFSSLEHKKTNFPFCSPLGLHYLCINSY